MLLLLGGVGYPLSTAGRLLGDASALALVLFVTWGVCSMVGNCSLALFTWLVFRRGQLRFTLGTLAYALAVVGLFVAQTLSPGWAVFAAGDQGPFRSMPFFSIAVLGWGGAESLLHHLRLRKRLALGLTDAASADRMRLWAISMFAACVISATALALREPGVPLESPLMALVVGPLGIVSSAAMWLAFMPPRRYLERVARRATAQGSSRRFQNANSAG